MPYKEVDFAIFPAFAANDSIVKHDDKGQSVPACTTQIQNFWGSRFWKHAPTSAENHAARGSQFRGYATAKQRTILSTRLNQPCSHPFRSASG